MKVFIGLLVLFAVQVAASISDDDNNLQGQQRRAAPHVRTTHQKHQSQRNSIHDKRTVRMEANRAAYQAFDLTQTTRRAGERQVFL